MNRNLALLSEDTSSAILDSAHHGDIVGALGTVRQHDDGTRHSWARRILTFLAIMGPGLIVMVGDNDAGGVATYAQAGQNYGTTLIWTLLLLIPVLIVAQEMVARLGTVTRVGHARLIRERFGRFWAAFSVGDLFILNFLTIVTEFIGVDLGLSYFGVSAYVSVPLAAVGLMVMVMTGSFRRWERFMFVFIATSLLMFPLALLSHPHLGPIVRGTFIPSVQGGFNSVAILFIIAIVGTTVAPWQLFFQQSNVIDKRITTRWLHYELADTVIGAVLTNLGAAALIIAPAFAFAHSHLAGHFANALTVANGLATRLGPAAGAMFSIILVNAAIIGASAVTLSTSYAIGDIFGLRHSLHRSFWEAKGFYAVFAALVAVAAGIVLLPGAPLGLITTGVQVLAGVLLPSAIVFLLLLCNDPVILGPWVNPRWLNIVATVIVAILVELSLILTVTTVFPTVSIAAIIAVTVLVGILWLIGVAGYTHWTHWRADRRTPPVPENTSDSTESKQTSVSYAQGSVLPISNLKEALPGEVENQRPANSDKFSWQMPPLHSLPPMVWTSRQKLGMYALRGYLIIAVVLLAVKIGMVALGH